MNESDITVIINLRALRDAIRSERLAADRRERARCEINEDFASYRESVAAHEKAMRAVDFLLRP